jgi:hypothetical protein
MVREKCSKMNKKIVLKLSEYGARSSSTKAVCAECGQKRLVFHDKVVAFSSLFL